MERPTDEVLLASAIKFLYEGQEIYEASLLLLCEINTHEVWHDYDELPNLTIEIIGNRAVYDAIQNEALTSKEIIERAFNAILPFGCSVESIVARVDLIDIDSDNWRKTMEEALEGKKKHLTNVYL